MTHNKHSITVSCYYYPYLFFKAGSFYVSVFREWLWLNTKQMFSRSNMILIQMGDFHHYGIWLMWASLRWKCERHCLLQTGDMCFWTAWAMCVWGCACVWVSLSLWIVVLGIPEECLGELTWVHATFWLASRDISPTWGQCCGWTGPYGSYYDCKMNLSNNHQGVSKKCLLLVGPGRVHGMPRATQWGPGGWERVCERAWTWGSAFIGVEGGVSRVLWAHSLWI